VRFSAGGAPARRWAASLSVWALVAGGCASTPRPPAAGEEPWQLPIAELGSQSLFRISYRGPQGSAGLKLILRLQDEAAYSLGAADLFGRPLWTLAVGGGKALWVDDRAGRWCALGSVVRLPDLGLPDLPLRAVPALLLGRVPLGPAEGLVNGATEYRDGDGRRWTFVGRAGEVASWTYWDGDRPSLWFNLQGGEMMLSSRQREAQLRWRRTLREPLGGEVPAPAPPPGFSQGGCDEPRLP
jgi:hypothetical protein